MMSSGTGRFFVKADNEQRMRSFQASIHEEVCGTCRLQVPQTNDCATSCHLNKKGLSRFEEIRRACFFHFQGYRYQQQFRPVQVKFATRCLAPWQVKDGNDMNRPICPTLQSNTIFILSRHISHSHVFLRIGCKAQIAQYLGLRGRDKCKCLYPLIQLGSKTLTSNYQTTLITQTPQGLTYSSRNKGYPSTK